MTALLTTFQPHLVTGVNGNVQVRLPGDAFVLTVHDESLDVTRGDTAADAALAGSIRAIQDLVFDHRPLGDAIRSGDVHVDGDTALLSRVLAAFNDQRAS